jgi:hypothetical protein
MMIKNKRNRMSSTTQRHIYKYQNVILFHYFFSLSLVNHLVYSFELKQKQEENI